MLSPQALGPSHGRQHTLSRLPDDCYSADPSSAGLENTSIPLTQRATMGYKGIQTSYLPTSTVPIKTSEVKGTKEALYY
ncbi:uncharacterized protein HaLaN_24883 [Haematococcus lacustris]|uniref:Uncharacterized protein n=1 Tax=Haematococcus lacustris TaxID=44745 RepID=A0A6A0A3E2_HAELA|nr:uncharacterized protein HaLaN_24883 [Haematococcus lacustris]